MRFPRPLPLPRRSPPPRSDNVDFRVKDGTATVVFDSCGADDDVGVAAASAVVAAGAVPVVAADPVVAAVPVVDEFVTLRSAVLALCAEGEVGVGAGGGVGVSEVVAAGNDDEEAEHFLYENCLFDDPL